MQYSEDVVVRFICCVVLRDHKAISRILWFVYFEFLVSSVLFYVVITSLGGTQLVPLLAVYLCARVMWFHVFIHFLSFFKKKKKKKKRNILSTFSW